MKDRFCNMMHFVCIILLVFVGTSYCADLKCGFPGTPKYGTIKPNKAAYAGGEMVTYICRVGYILLGSTLSRCKYDGTWSDEVPVCDDSMTTLVSAYSTATAVGYPAENAIDKDKDKCTYLQPKDPRWWRIDLGYDKEYTVLSVAITMKNIDKYVKFTVFVIQIQDQISSFKRCASFSGKFGTETIVLLCAEGKGIDGHRVHIEDYDKQDTGYFEICEVEIQVKKDDGYECGIPSRSLYLEQKSLSEDEVEYECLRGYKLLGEDTRYCQEELGQWSGEPPVCLPIVCNELEPFENGFYKIHPSTDGPALEGAVVIYNCKPNYKLIGKSTRTCLENGFWSGRPPRCKVVTCPAEIPYDVGGKWRYQNVRVGSIATLRCNNEKYQGDNLQIECTEDGVWSEPEAQCLIPIALAKKESKPRIVNQGGIIFGMVLAAIMIVVVLVGVYLYDQRRRNNKPVLPSRFQDPPLPPPRPPPRAKENAFRTAFKGFLNRENLDSDRPDKNSWKTQSLPSNQSPIDETDSNLNSKKALSYGESLPDDSPAVVEVEVLPPHRSGRKGVITPVPEEPENATVDDVVLEMDEADSNKDSSANDNKTGSDYAAVDYEKKRQSRLLKEQDSIESSSTSPGSPLPLDESDKKELSRSSTPAKNLEESEEEEEEEEEESDASQNTESQKKREAEERKAKEEEERKAKEEEERKAKEEEERKKKEEEEKKKKEEAGSRRRRARDEPPPTEAEEKPVLRRLRRLQ